MALTITLTPGYVFTDNETVTSAKLNLAANPTINLAGSISTLALADGSVTTPKLADGVLSADSTGRGKMADGFLSADATGRGKMANNYLTAVLAEETFREGVAQYAVGTFTAGVYAISLNPAATAYTAGMRVVFKPDTVNAGGDSINVNGLGAKALMTMGTVAVVANQIKAGQIITCVYDGTAFQIENGDGQYLGAETAISSGLMINVAHGLGVAPSVMRWILRCKTAELGYSVGDEVDAQVAMTAFSGGFVPGLIGGANVTNAWVICTSTTLSILRKDTFAQTNITAANWKVAGYLRR